MCTIELNCWSRNYWTDYSLYIYIWINNNKFWIIINYFNKFVLVLFHFYALGHISQPLRREGANKQLLLNHSDLGAHMKEAVSYLLPQFWVNFISRRHTHESHPYPNRHSIYARQEFQTSDLTWLYVHRTGSRKALTWLTSYGTEHSNSRLLLEINLLSILHKWKNFVLNKYNLIREQNCHWYIIATNKASLIITIK